VALIYYAWRRCAHLDQSLRCSPKARLDWVHHDRAVIHHDYLYLTQYIKGTRLVVPDLARIGAKRVLYYSVKLAAAHCADGLRA
jgi:hypothetical protein